MGYGAYINLNIMSAVNKRIYAITLRKAHSYMKARGFDTADLLANTELSEGDLADPYSLINEDQARIYYANLVRLVDRDGVGLEIGWMTALSDMGPHGMTELTERTVGDAMRNTWTTRDNYNLLVDWDYEVKGGVLIQRFRCEEPEEKLRIFMIERGLGTLQAQCEELLGADQKPLRVLLDYKAPANIDNYKDIFRCPLRFSQPATEMHYPADWLDRPVETYDPQAVDMLGELRTRLYEKLSSGGDIVHDVTMALRRTPGKFPSLERIAEDMAMSSRTLRRKLGQHDVRYQDILDRERRRVAEDFLLNTSFSVQQIADKCGFTDAQNFSQAFKRWAGMSPTEFRQSRSREDD
jgi:AraC-like DNA-binding protein